MRSLQHIFDWSCLDLEGLLEVLRTTERILRDEQRLQPERPSDLGVQLFDDADQLCPEQNTPAGFATVSTTSIPFKAPMYHESQREPLSQRGPFWTPITLPRGSFFHAEWAITRSPMPLLRNATALQTGFGTLAARHSTADRQLARAVKAACRTGQGQTVVLPQFDSDSPPLIGLVIPMAAATTGAPFLAKSSSSRCALILVKDPSRSPRPDTDVLRQVLGLTTAEARLLADLVSGSGNSTHFAGCGAVALATNPLGCWNNMERVAPGNARRRGEFARTPVLSLSAVMAAASCAPSTCHAVRQPRRL